MLIRFEDIKVGDEIIIPSKSELKYLKVLKKISTRSLKCSICRKDIPSPWNSDYILSNQFICEPNISKHNSIYYFTDIFKAIWLVKRG